MPMICDNTDSSQCIGDNKNIYTQRYIPLLRELPKNSTMWLIDILDPLMRETNQCLPYVRVAFYSMPVETFQICDEYFESLKASNQRQNKCEVLQHVNSDESQFSVGSD